MRHPGRYQKAIEEYAGECAIAKVFCSNNLAMVADEALQIHGGYGYIKDYPVERYYRDQRINRIFEGTNEINRLLIPTLLFRRAESGALNLWEQVAAAQAGPLTDVNEGAGGNVLFGAEFSLLANQKKIFLLLLGALGECPSEQEILLALGDMIISIFALDVFGESRVVKITNNSISDTAKIIITYIRGDFASVSTG